MSERKLLLKYTFRMLSSRFSCSMLRFGELVPLTPPTRFNDLATDTKKPSLQNIKYSRFIPQYLETFNSE